MKSRNYALYAVLAAAALAMWFVPRPAKETGAPPADAPSPPPRSGDVPVTANSKTTPDGSGGESDVSARVGSVATSTNPSAHPSVAAPAQPLNTGEPDQAAQIDVGRVRHMISDYHTLMGENPVGTNAEIMKQMMGGNSRQATLGPPDGMALNGQGELVDQWGTPIFFHQLSRDKMEVRSAGPDKVMWTADDVVAR